MFVVWGRHERRLKPIFGGIEFQFFRKNASCANSEDNMLPGVCYSTIRPVFGSQFDREKLSTVLLV